MRRFLCSKTFGRPCRAPNPEVGCEPGGVINMTGILLVIGFLVLVVMALNCLTHRKYK